MNELVKWLREQFDEDAELAAPGESWSMFPEGDFGTPRVDVDHSIERVVAATRAWRAKHIAAHDPVRVLREIDAKRAMLNEHKPDGWSCSTCAGQEDFDEDANGDREWSRHGKDFPCPTLRLLALPYADRPGYQESWRP